MFQEDGDFYVSLKAIPLTPGTSVGAQYLLKK